MPTSMPTMTKQTLDRRLNRHSLDNQIDDISATNRRGQMHYSLTSAENKENFGVHFLHSPFGHNNSLIALHDLSNGRSPRRAETPTSLRRRTLSSLTMGTMSQMKEINAAKSLLSEKRVNSLTGSLELFTENYDSENENKCHNCYNVNKMPEESLSSSHMGDVTLDLVLDAIIESARKDVRAVCKRTIDKMNYDFQRPHVPETRSVTPLYGIEDFAETSIHEMEVCTPPHLKRQRVVRRKNPKTAKNSDKSQIPANSYKTAGVAKTEILLAKNDVYRTNNFSSREKSDKFQVERSPTPSLEEAQSIKRCLSFTSDNKLFQHYDDDDVDFSAAKRSSVASSNASSMNGEFFNFNSGRSSRSSRNSLRGDPKGSLELNTQIRDNILNVHVIRCRDLQRASGSTVLNAYVKVAIISNKNIDKHKIMDNGYQRTAVHRHSSRPFFDHWFKFDLVKTFDKLTYFDNEDRLQLAVWHRDRQLKRSEFLGCLSFQLPTLLQQAINGAYKLQSQACLNNPQPPVPIIVTTVTTAVQNSQRNQIVSTDIITTSTITTNTLPSLTSPNINQAEKPHPLQLLKPNKLFKMTTTSAVTKHHPSDEDVESIDDGTAQAVEIDALEVGGDSVGGTGMQKPMVLSKKALHQRDADENLFLRFLELDPLPAEPEKPNIKTTNSILNTPNNNTKDTRRLSNTPAVQPIGRTPFTITKRLTRTAERGFGFSIVWTHPPRVEKVEPGLSADRKGIMPGDYVIFVDKHNVVTMPEADVLNLIRAQGSDLTLEIFRRPAGCAGMVQTALSFSGRSNATTMAVNGKTTTPTIVGAEDVLTVTPTPTMIAASRQFVSNHQQQIVNINNNNNARPATVCSNSSSMEAAKRRLNLPQVTFSKESIMPVTDSRRRFLLQLISREQNFISALHFGIQRFVQPLQERKDLISPNDHRTLFQNIDELLRISEDILEQLSNDGQEPQMNFASRVYLSKTTAICAAYKKYLNGIKRADCVLVNKSRQAGSDFVAFITEPPVPRKRPDLTMFIHRPLQHFREILKLMQMLSTNCHVDTEEYKNFNSVINELQAAYREITISSGLMEPLGEGRPLLTLQDLESRMVFTKCKPFTLAVQGRQWIFGGDLSRVEGGRSVKPYWALLFSDIIVFAKVSRDRVLFITEEPVPIANIVDSCFNMRKKTTEFRLTVDPNGRLAESPTGYCAPDLSRTPKKGLRRKNLILRAPSLELKAVWQNLLQRQIFLVNAALGSTPLSSPLDSPDVLNTLVPLSDIRYASASIGSIKIPSMDSINLRNQQHQQQSHQKGGGGGFPQTNEQIEMLIDEKCRILNKTGTPKSSALHLANWMKGQLDKQQQQALRANDRTIYDDVRQQQQQQQNESDQEERITYWTRQQLEKRTKELNLEKEGGLRAKLHGAGKRLSGVDELSMSDAYSEAFSQISKSHSTTSDSQITVRSSPIVLDKLAVCRHCHKNCQQLSIATPKNPTSHSQAPAQIKSTSTMPPSSCLSSHTLQEHAASAIICCKQQQQQQLNGKILSSNNSSNSSLSSSTITVDRSSKCVASSSDVAQILTDDLSQSQSEATCENIGGIPSTSSTGRDEAQYKRQFNNKLSESIRILSTNTDATTATKSDTIINGHFTPTSLENNINEKIIEGNIKNETKEHINNNNNYNNANNTANINSNNKNEEIRMKISTPTKSPKSTHTKVTLSLHTTKFIACNCDCTPADFANTTLSPDELEQQTCKILASPKQSLQMHELENTDENPTGLPVQFSNIKHFVPTIAVLPATPEAVLTKTSTNIWDNRTKFCNLPLVRENNNIPEDSCDESPLDEELPYRPMSHTLRRYGTMSSLEKLPSEERMAPDDMDDLEDQLNNADDEDDDLDDDDDNARADTVIYENQHADNQYNSISQAEAMAGSKMTFFEESRAFIDRYLGRWHDSQSVQANSETEIDECTSGATSGEEVWGTPTSGGDNDDMHLINSENTYSSPTKSSNSLNDDDDEDSTELMMDELLMAPMAMTASTIRGLLPRRRLEPLFEEETESDEEKTQQDNDDELTKGETTRNGRDSENSNDTSCSNSNAETSMNEIDMVQRIHPNHPIIVQGPRPLRHPDTLLPRAVLKASACETLLETTCMNKTISPTASKQLLEEKMTMTLTTEATMKLKNQTLASTSTTISNVNVITSKDNVTKSMDTMQETTSVSVVRQAKFIPPPPPPPPRRLLLTKQNISGATVHENLVGRKKFGIIADVGSRVDAIGQKKKDAIGVHYPKLITKTNNNNNMRSSSTIIETSLLGMNTRETSMQICTSSATTSSVMSIARVKQSKLRESVISTTTTNQTKISENMESYANVPICVGSNLSPRLEMRLALNHDIMGDEDLMCYNPGPQLTSILGHDLSTFQRLTGRDLLNRSANLSQAQVNEAAILCSQQQNWKMDTPTVNRRPRPSNNNNNNMELDQPQQNHQQMTMAMLGLGGGSARVGGVPQHLQPNRNTWSNSAYAAQSVDERSANVVVNENYNESNLSDLEILARREKIFCTSQLRSGSPQVSKMIATISTAKAMTKTALTKSKHSFNHQFTRATNTKSIANGEPDKDSEETISGAAGGLGLRKRKIGRDETALMETGRANRLKSFLKRRNSEMSNTSLGPSSQSSENNLTDNSQLSHTLSPRKDVDKPSLNRRLWKQITRRRRANSMSEIVAN